MQPVVATNCCICQDRLTLRTKDWWHNKRDGNTTRNNADLCTSHYWKLSRRERKLYTLVTTAEDLGAERTAYISDFSDKWWGGGRNDTRVAVLCGGGWFDRPDVGELSGGPVQACDKDSVLKIVETLQDVGFNVIQIDADELGGEDDTGEKARSALAECRACVVPGGHDVAQAKSLGKLGKAALANLLEQGGGMVGICGGAWLLGHGDGILDHNFRWLPVACDPHFGDNGLKAMATVDATKEGINLLGEGLLGEVLFDESPSMSLISPGLELNVLVKYGSEIHPTSFAGAAAIQRIGKETMQSLVGSAAVVSGLSEEFSSHPRIVLIGPHWEMTPGASKGHVVARAVAWVAGRIPNTSFSD